MRDLHDGQPTERGSMSAHRTASTMIRSIDIIPAAMPLGSRRRSRLVHMAQPFFLACAERTLADVLCRDCTTISKRSGSPSLSPVRPHGKRGGGHK